MFANAKSASADRLQQTGDHHRDLLAHQKEMKALEERKVVLQENAARAANWSEKTAETNYKYNMYLKYKSMSEDGWPDEMILDLMPQLAAVIKAKSAKRPAITAEDDSTVDDSPSKPAAKSSNNDNDSPAKRTRSKKH